MKAVRRGRNVTRRRRANNKDMNYIEGLRVLIVEDELMVAIFLEDALQERGCVIAGVAGHADEARSIIESNGLDAAILDVNLDGRRSFGLARLLREKNVPVIFATGYGLAGVPEEFAAVPVLTKPFTEEQMANLLAQVTGRDRTGSSC